MLYYMFWCIRIVSIWVICLLWHHRTFVKHVCISLAVCTGEDAAVAFHCNVHASSFPRGSGICLPPQHTHTVTLQGIYFFLLSSYLSLLIYFPHIIVYSFSHHTQLHQPHPPWHKLPLYHSLFKLHPLNSCEFLVHVNWQTLWPQWRNKNSFKTGIVLHTGKHTQVFNGNNSVAHCPLHQEIRNCLLYYIHTVPSHFPFAALKWLKRWIIHESPLKGTQSFLITKIYKVQFQRVCTGGVMFLYIGPGLAFKLFLHALGPAS